MKPIQLVLSTIAFATLSTIVSIASASEYVPAPEAEAVVSSLSRDQVRAETLAAVRNGQLARTDAEMERIAALCFQSLKTREQVIAETREAARMGLLARNGRDEVSLSPTPEQLFQIIQAGLRTRFVELAMR